MAVLVAVVRDRFQWATLSRDVRKRPSSTVVGVH